MAIQWAVLKAQLARKLKDPDHRTYDEDLLLDAVNDALVAFASSHTGVASDFDIEGDGETSAFPLPDNIIEDEGAGVYAVHWGNNQWLRELEYFPGTQWTSPERTTDSSPLGFILWPQNTITFSRIPESGQTVTIHYVAYYDPVVDDDSMINVPRWAEEAIKLYAAATALEPGATKAAKLGNYKTRKDSGGPEDNPLLQLARRYMERYYRILAQHPVPQYNKLMARPGG